jgi:AcrR family transcriptional regulator
MNEQQPADTRTRIQQVALDLFVEQGYEKTSLREIAERLGVTKAALYYHFKTKEDIVASTVHDYLHAIDELTEWGRSQPRTLETRKEIIRRYADIVAVGGRSMRFFQQNPAQGKALGEGFRERMRSMFELITDEDSPLTDQIRAMLALFGQGMAMMLASEEARMPGGPRKPEEVRSAALEVALDLIRPREPGRD